MSLGFKRLNTMDDNSKTAARPHCNPLLLANSK